MIARKNQQRRGPPLKIILIMAFDSSERKLPWNEWELLIWCLMRAISSPSIRVSRAFRVKVVSNTYFVGYLRWLQVVKATAWWIIQGVLSSLILHALYEMAHHLRGQGSIPPDICWRKSCYNGSFFFDLSSMTTAVKITNNFLLTWNFGCWNTLKMVDHPRHDGKKCRK